MRIIQVVNVRWFNATAWYGLELARLARDAGHDSLVLGLEGTEPLQRAEALGLETRALPFNAKSPLVWPGLLARMASVVRDFKPDVVNCHRGEAFVLWAALKGMGFGLVRTRGDQRPPKGNPVNAWLYARAADAVIATNSVTAGQLRDTLHVPANTLHTIFGGVDTDRFAFDAQGRERVRAQLGYREKDVVVGLLGRFDAVKGQRESITALARLVREGLSVRLLLIGFSSATEEREVRTWIREAGMDHAIDISGRVDDVPVWISATDLGLVSSLWSETIARAALEIMACGRPLVSTNVGVMPDLLPQEALCGPNDIDALTELLRRAVQDAAWREDLCAANRQRLTELNSRSFWEATLAVYEQLVKPA